MLPELCPMTITYLNSHLGHTNSDTVEWFIVLVKGYPRNRNITNKQSCSMGQYISNEEPFVIKKEKKSNTRQLPSGSSKVEA